MEIAIQKKIFQNEDSNMERALQEKNRLLHWENFGIVPFHIKLWNKQMHTFTIKKKIV